MGKKKVVRGKIQRRSAAVAEEALLAKYRIARPIFLDCLERKVITLKSKKIRGIVHYEISPAVERTLKCVAAHPESFATYSCIDLRVWDEAASKVLGNNDDPYSRDPTELELAEYIGEKPRALHLMPFFPFLMYLICTRSNRAALDEIEMRGLHIGHPRLVTIGDMQRWRDAAKAVGPKELQRVFDGKLPSTPDERRCWAEYSRIVGLETFEQDMTAFDASMFQEPRSRIGVEAVACSLSRNEQVMAMVHEFYNMDMTEAELETYGFMFYRFDCLSESDYQWYFATLLKPEREQKFDATQMPFGSYLVKYGIPTQGGIPDMVDTLVRDQASLTLSSAVLPEDEKALRDKAKRIQALLQTLRGMGFDTMPTKRRPFMAAKQKTYAGIDISVPASNSTAAS